MTLQGATVPVGPVAGPSATSVANRRWLNVLLRGRSFAVLVVLALLVVLFSVTTENFATADSFRSITVNAALFAIVACGQGVVILTRNYDLSVGATMGLAAYIAYDWGHQVGDLAPVVIPAIAIGIGLVAGLINGVLVGYFRIPSIAATLGTLSIFRGILFVYGDGRIVTRDLIPEWAISIVSTQVLGVVASLVIIAAIVAVAAAIALRSLPLGRQIYAVGSNPDAVDFYGLDSRRTIALAYVFCGLMAGLAGFLFGPQVGYIIQYAGQNYELTAIAACVIGGISVLGGSGNILGAALGALVLATINNGLVQLQLPEFARLVILGVVIVVAVMVDAVIQRRVRSILRSMRRRAVPA